MWFTDAAFFINLRGYQTQFKHRGGMGYETWSLARKPFRITLKWYINVLLGTQ